MTVPHLNSFAGGFLLIAKIGRLLEVFVLLWLFFDLDHGLLLLRKVRDHGLLCSFLRFRLGR